jgi:hypothetical protein
MNKLEIIPICLSKMIHELFGNFLFQRKNRMTIADFRAHAAAYVAGRA